MSRLLFTGLNSGKGSYGRIVGAEGSYFILDDGRRLLDASNTGGPIGHQHPEIVKAVAEAASSPTINEGWMWRPREEAAEELISTAFRGEEDWVGAVRFFLSGSEANDLALSLCQALTGRELLATRERAYHGMTGLARNMTVQPHWHGGLSSRDGHVRPAPRSGVVELPAPAGAHYGQSSWAEPHGPLSARAAASELRGVAAVIIDYTQGGVYYDAEYQDTVAEAAQRAGALWIADEVVTGLGRSGRMFAFQGPDSRPDIVTLGKPLGGGGAPAGAVVISKRLLEQLADQSWQTYSTFRGHPLTIAAIRAYLRIMDRDQLTQRVNELEPFMRGRLIALAEAHPSVTRVDGRGLHWTIELAGSDWREWHAATTETPLATAVAERAAEAGALVGTSGEDTSLFLSPPLNVETDELERIFEALDHGLGAADGLAES